MQVHSRIKNTLFTQVIFAIFDPERSCFCSMSSIKIVVFFLVLAFGVSAQTYTQRLNPDVSASLNEICPNDEVEITLSYNVPNNKSLLLNGLDEYANMPADPAFDFGAATNFTIECYVKTSSVAPQALVSKGSPVLPGFIVGMNAGKVAVGMLGSGGNAAINGFTDIADGLWHHVAVVFDRTNKATIYIDGFFDNDGAISSVGDITNAELLRVGAFDNGVAISQFFSGNIDEVRIWDKARSIAEILARRTVHVNVNSVVNLVGYWDMNELSGTTLIDCSPTGATGVLTNSASFSADSPTLTWNFNPVWSTGQSGVTTIFANPLDTTTFKVEIGYCKYLSADSVTVNVTPCEDVDETGLLTSMWVPSAFSPNGDYKNDVFLVQASNIRYYEIMIFNRLGNIVYHSRDILNSWDGTFEGNRVKDDVYTYVITYRDRKEEQHKKHGTVTVLH